MMQLTCTSEATERGVKAAPDIGIAINISREWSVQIIIVDFSRLDRDSKDMLIMPLDAIFFLQYLSSHSVGRTVLMKSTVVESTTKLG